MQNFLEDIQIASLAHYSYCPKSAYIAYVSEEFIDNEFTIHGRQIHNRVDSGIITKRKELLQIRAVWLRSNKYGLIGKADMIEEKNGEVYPVEYKRGKINDWDKAKIQLTAQAFCLEEMLNLKEKIKKGYVFYHLSNTREEVEIDQDLRKKTINVINEMRELLVSRKIPQIEYSNKCPNCSVYPVCLPKEVERVKEILKGIDN